jgi:hypothetical protein
VALRRTCFLARFSRVPCSGRLVKAHLIPRQVLKREVGKGWSRYVKDERSFVPACGGLVGLSGHHGALDHYALRIPRAAIPAGTEELAAELGLTWWLDRRYGQA